MRNNKSLLASFWRDTIIRGIGLIIVLIGIYFIINPEQMKKIWPQINSPENEPKNHGISNHEAKRLLDIGAEIILPGESKKRVSFSKDGFVYYNNNLLGKFADNLSYSNLILSSPSPQKELFLILCWDEDGGGKDGYIVNNNKQTVIAKNIVPPRVVVQFKLILLH